MADGRIWHITCITQNTGNFFYTSVLQIIVDMLTEMTLPLAVTNNAFKQVTGFYCFCSVMPKTYVHISEDTFMNKG